MSKEKKTIRPIITVIRRPPKDTHRAATHSDPRPSEEDPWERYDRAYGVADPFISPPVVVADPSTDQPSEEGVTSQLPQGTFSAGSVLPRGVFDDIEFALPEALGSKYHDIRFWKDGGTRMIFTAYWGPQDEKRIIKVDKHPANITSPRSQRNVARGNVSANDMETLAAIPDAEQHGLMRLLDYADLSEHGRGKVVVEPYFPSQSLEARITSDGAFSFNAARKPFEQIFKAAQYFVNTTGKLHRDIKPDNILIGTGNATGQIRITDFANARNADEIDTKHMPTVGSADSNDWQLYSTLTGREAAYTEQSEVFAYGMSYAFARLGKRFISIDPDAKVATALDTGESLLNADGKMDAVKYHAAVNRALASLPRKERAFVHKAITSNLAERYDSLDELVSAFDKMHEPGFVKRMTKGWRGFAWGGVIATNVVLMGAYLAAQRLADRNDQTLTEMVTEAKRYEVEARWNGKGPELVDNLVDVDVYVQAREASYPKKPYVKVAPGENISVYVTAKQVPRPETSAWETIPFLRCRAYFQGLPFQREQFSQDERTLAGMMNRSLPKNGSIRNDFVVYPQAVDETTLIDNMGETGGGYFSLDVPHDLPEGVYILAVESYEPDKKRSEEQSAQALRFRNHEKILTYEPVPVIVGNPRFSVDLEHINFNKYGYEAHGVFFSDLMRDPVLTSRFAPEDLQNVRVVATLPSEDYRTELEPTGGSGHYRLTLPAARPSQSEEERVQPLEITMYDNQNKPIFYTAVPVQREMLYPNAPAPQERWVWNFGRWDQSASEFLVGRHPLFGATNSNTLERVNDKK